MTSRETYDLLVIGGGINGVGIARDAAGRGAKVLLTEKDDLASHTSSASTKLVHGGLRYLEHYEFRLVRESLVEREVLLRNAPHIIWPLRFVLPHDKGLRPAWLLRLGLFLYDYIGGRKLLPPAKSLSFAGTPHREILEDRLVTGFEYSDCWVEDSRLVALNALDAAERGATIATRSECVGLRRQGESWLATLRTGDADVLITARAVVNAAGPWVDDVLGNAVPGQRHENLRLVKGSHLVVPRLFEGDQCYIFQNGDGRIVFAIPYERDFTLLGTTDMAFDGDPGSVEISNEETQYICNAVNEYLRDDIKPADAVWSYSGVRPLYDDKSASNSTVTRDYVFELNHEGPEGIGAPPILSIFGGKITTYRKLAEHAMEKLAAFGVVNSQPWTTSAPLPGGEGLHPESFADFVEVKQAKYPWFPAGGILRLARAYGSRMDSVFGNAESLSDLGQHFGADLYQHEVDYLCQAEFAETADDILWRRSKLGLHLDKAEQQALKNYLIAVPAK